MSAPPPPPAAAARRRRAVAAGPAVTLLPLSAWPGRRRCRSPGRRPRRARRRRPRPRCGAPLREPQGQRGDQRDRGGDRIADVQPRGEVGVRPSSSTASQRRRPAPRRARRARPRAARPAPQGHEPAGRQRRDRRRERADVVRVEDALLGGEDDAWTIAHTPNRIQPARRGPCERACGSATGRRAGSTAASGSSQAIWPPTCSLNSRHSPGSAAEAAALPPPPPSPKSRPKPL